MKKLGRDIKTLSDQGWTVSEIADFLGMNRRRVINAARLIENVTLKH